VATVGEVEIPVRLATLSAYRPASIDYATYDISATAGEEYVAQSDTLSFAPGETEKFIVVPLLDDGVPDEGKQFGIVLSNEV